MISHTTIRAALVSLCWLLPAPFILASTNDRVYLMGEEEGGVNGTPVSTTWDSEGELGQSQLIDLNAVGGPVYRSFTGRPDGASGVGIEFNAAQSQYLRGESLNWPQNSFSGLGGNFVGTINYNGISNRGMQFWVRPDSTAVQSIVLDSNQHGVRINELGNFSMRYAGRDTDSGLSVVPGNWYHVAVVRPSGVAGGSRLYIDGIAVAADNLSDYASSSANLVIGANTGGDDGLTGGVGFTGGTAEFFTGLIDELTMFVIGNNSNNAGPPPGMNWGSFNFATDNAFAEFTLSGVLGDIDNNGVFGTSDRDAFVAGWQSQNLVNGVLVGDLGSFANGDLNFDGRTDIFDLTIFQSALAANGFAALTAADLSGTAVPEPTSIAVLLLTGGLLLVARRTRGA
jgi:hypothetical protein